MKIDSHQHFWYYNPQRENWINDSMMAIRKDFLPTDLKPVLNRNHFDGCVAIQANESEDESEFLLNLAGRNSFIKGVVGWINLIADSSQERLSHFTKNPLFKGIRSILQTRSNEYITSKNFWNSISKLSEFDLTYDLLIQEHQLPAVIKLVKEFPNQRFVLDHMAKPQVSKGLSPKWTENIQNLASMGNVYCKISGLLTETENFKWKPDNFVPFIEIVSNAFGEDKLMYGSDWPVCLCAGKYEDTSHFIKEYFSQKGEIVYDKIFGKNAMEFYRLQ